jgi:TAT (twin-arginine translocation) pathway signal sequence
MTGAGRSCFETRGRNFCVHAMRNRKWSRRDVLKTSTALAAGALFAEPVKARYAKLFKV